MKHPVSFLPSPRGAGEGRGRPARPILHRYKLANRSKEAASAPAANHRRCDGSTPRRGFVTFVTYPSDSGGDGWNWVGRVLIYHAHRMMPGVPKKSCTVHIATPATGLFRTYSYSRKSKKAKPRRFHACGARIAPRRDNPAPNDLEDELSAIPTRDSQSNAAAATLRQMIMSFRVTQMIHV